MESLHGFFTFAFFGHSGLTIIYVNGGNMKKALASIGFAAAIALGGTALSATPAAPVVDRAQAASYTSCFLAMDGMTYCYRYGCTWFEYYALGCRDGWVRMTNWYA